jgi:hypothetical protein
MVIRTRCAVRKTLRHFQVILKSINTYVFQVVTACVIVYANIKQNKSKGILKNKRTS